MWAGCELSPRRAKKVLKAAAVLVVGLHMLRRLVWISWKTRKNGTLGSERSSDTFYLDWDCCVRRWCKQIVTLKAHKLKFELNDNILD